MSESVKIVALVGSLRAESINRKVAELAAAGAPESVSVEIYEGLATVPFYDEDLDVEPLDPAVDSLRTALSDADAVLIVTPEYNGTIPAVVKNAIDWGSRPYGNGSLKDKPVAVIGASLGRYAGKWSQEDARKSVGIAGGKVVDSIEVGIATSELDGRAVSDVPELVEQVRSAVADLVAAVGVTV
ncbi:NADPH-dependent FMN reductase [Williamsia sp.]|uniref:NAD(P)H-dependent oxidoreductase n=1 Tax=Williamsia sp. TaxID=1872085 RepID=UPI001A2BECDD|nr:NADPH-dependent FMN reductase [Williamsia sp.]MBJ7289868.1 NAD(P)H-dependent oxidoreductase [Williamsia sp.]